MAYFILKPVKQAKIGNSARITNCQNQRFHPRHHEITIFVIHSAPMGIIKRQSIKSTLVVYFGMLLGYVNLLLLAPMILSPEEIGLTKVLYDGSYALAAVAQLGLWSVATKFYTFFKSKENSDNGFLFYFTTIPLIGFLLLSTSLLVFKSTFIGLFIHKSPLIVDYYYYFIPLLFIVMYYQVFETYSSLQLRIVMPNFLREVLIKLVFFVIITLLIFELISFELFIDLYVLSYALSLLILVFYLRLLKALHWKPNFRFITAALRKDIIVFWVFVFFGSLGAFAIGRMDVIMISSMSGLYFAGVYSISYLLGNFIEVPRRAIAQISVPIISESWKNNNLEKIAEIYKKTSINQTIFTGYLFMIIWVNIDPIFSLIPNSELYVSGKYVALFIGLARFIDAATGVNTEILMNSHKHYRFNLILLFMMGVLTVVLNYLLIPVLNMYGACLSVLIAVVLYNLFKFVFILHRWKMQPFSIHSLKIILLLAGLTALTYILPQHPNAIAQIFILSVPLTLVFMLLCYVLKISSDYNELVRGSLKRVRALLRKTSG
jgi:O-antigen/teichoic acid export membrane protein